MVGSLSSLQSLHLGNNKLHGKIPSLENCSDLYILDLGGNRLKGNIPVWVEQLSSLRMLRLRSNVLEGSIPEQLSLHEHLQVLDIADSNLSGTIPQWLGNLTAMSSSEQTIIKLFKSYKATAFLDREEVTLSLLYEVGLLVAVKGGERKFSNTLSLVVSLDLSENNFSGEIPEEMTKLFALRYVNLSGNHLHGRIPQKIDYLHQLGSLDLLRNQLSGEIPSSISSLAFINHWNSSYNNLWGRIPSGNQLQTLNDPSVYAGNRYLCGIQSPKKCSSEENLQVLTPSVDDIGGSDKSQTIGIYLGGIVGFVVGFWSVCGPLLLKKSWGISYFKYHSS